MRCDAAAEPLPEPLHHGLKMRGDVQGKAAQKSLSADGRLVVLGSAHGDVIAFDLATGAVAWRAASALQGCDTRLYSTLVLPLSPPPDCHMGVCTPPPRLLVFLVWYFQLCHC